MSARNLVWIAVVLVVAAMSADSAVLGQAGQGLLDVDTAPAERLATLPHMSSEIVEGIVGRRPFMSIVELDSYLTGAGLDAEQTTEFYRRAFVQVNLNTGSEQEFLLIPGAGRRMAHEFEEYRPWKSWAQFDREIGKYVAKDEVDRFKQYVFVPLDLNTATGEELRSIPGVGRRMAHEFEEYRPWRTREQFEREIGKYVEAKEVARLWRYVTIRPTD